MVEIPPTLHGLPPRCWHPDTRARMEAGWDPAYGDDMIRTLKEHWPEECFMRAPYQMVGMTADTDADEVWWVRSPYPTISMQDYWYLIDKLRKAGSSNPFMTASGHWHDYLHYTEAELRSAFALALLSQ